MQWFYMHFPHLYGETWHSPFEREHPVILAREQDNCVADANDSARAKGIERNMLVNTAFCLVPEMDIHIMLPHKEIQALKRVARFAYRFSGWVGLDEPDGLYLEVASMRRFFGGLPQLKAGIEELFRELGYDFHIAAAPTPKAARILARSGIELCADKQRFRQALKQMPVDCLELPAPILIRLQKLGMRSVQDVANLPPGDLSYRVDKELATNLAQALGQSDWKPEPFHLPESFRLKIDVEQEFESLNPLLFPMASAVKRFCRFMQNRCLVSQQLILRLIHRTHPATTFSIHLATADNRVDSWVYMLSMQIDRVVLPAPVTGFELKASDFEDIPPTSFVLFQDSANTHEDKKAYLLNRLAARVGADQIHFIGLSDDYRPERQTLFSSQPLPPEALPDNLTAQSPLWLLQVPLQINIRRYQVIRGPLRMNSGWWDSVTASRDYYIAATSGQNPAALHWLFKTPPSQWFLHGIFA
ncbi:Y-family DNA polymerase [Hahella ganghwensis]|uniref:Y-family DNA polymerase n=1 Tax=Hahella ganghwensis TaxID=286420 RepID=UPI0003A707DA|nr:DNA polymerase Y family protein [Hahella ganghwensis]